MSLPWPRGFTKEWPEEYQDGATEPWVQQVVAALLTASFGRSVLELGCYKGHTAAWLCQALQDMGGGTYLGVDIEAERQRLTMERLAAMALPDVTWNVVQGDALAVLRGIPPGSLDFVWVDDNHDPAHVVHELELLHNPVHSAASRMRPGGLICMHDVCGGEDRMQPLSGVCVAAHGYALTFPRIGLLGGLGLIQVPLR